jgi:hypothetical protein
MLAADMRGQNLASLRGGMNALPHRLQVIP